MASPYLNGEEGDDVVELRAHHALRAVPSVFHPLWSRQYETTLRHFRSRRRRGEGSTSPSAVSSAKSPNGVARSSAQLPRRTRNPSMSVRYLGSPALHKKTSASLASSRGRRPLISVDSACYIAANYGSRRDYYEHHRQANRGAFRSCSSHAERNRGVHCAELLPRPPPRSHHFDARRRRRPLPQRKHGGRQPAREQGRTQGGEIRQRGVDQMEEGQEGPPQRAAEEVDGGGGRRASTTRSSSRPSSRSRRAGCCRTVPQAHGRHCRALWSGLGTVESPSTCSTRIKTF